MASQAVLMLYYCSLFSKPETVELKAVGTRRLGLWLHCRCSTAQPQCIKSCVDLAATRRQPRRPNLLNHSHHQINQRKLAFVDANHTAAKRKHADRLVRAGYGRCD